MTLGAVPIRIAALIGLVLMTASSALPNGFRGKTDVFTGPAAFSHTTRDGARYDDRVGGFRLVDDGPDGYRKEGTIVSEPLHYGFGFDYVVPSWNADCPKGTWIRVELQARLEDSDAWTSWYEIATWGDPDTVRRIAADAATRKDAHGRVNEDILELKSPSTRLRYRVTLHTERPEVTPVVTLLAVAALNTKQEVEPDDSKGPAWGVEVPADFRSQLVENADISWRICGPTSVAMALTAHGISVPTATVADACWDGVNRIYGNWPFMAAAASRLMREQADRLKPRPGRKPACIAFVAFPPDWKGVEEEILNGNPCILSIRYGRDELKGAPSRSSDGHLILVRGFTDDGNVICCDPAAWTEEKGRIVYDRKELHAARHGGPVIVIRPYGG